MKDLQRKTYLFNEYFQNTNMDKITYDDICRVLCEIFNSNVYIIDNGGFILGYKNYEKNHKTIDLKVDTKLTNKLLSISKTKININNDSICILKSDEIYGIKQKYSVIVPVVAAGVRTATVVLNKFYEGFYESDLILFEYISTIVGFYIYKEELFKIKEKERNDGNLRNAFQSLSKTEERAIISILKFLEYKDGVIVVSDIAKKSKITRSVIVNSIKKFESAGVIEGRSLGSRGTYIKIINEELKSGTDSIRL